VVKKGDAVEVVILNIDSENKRISLGLKQAEADPWLTIGETFPIGLEIRGRAVRMMDKGVVIDLGNDIEGFAPVSQLGVENITEPGEAVKEGQVVDTKVLEVDPIHHRIVVAVTGYPDEPIIPPVKPVIEPDTPDDDA
jgi:small subunit ribosomal protein S1